MSVQILAIELVPFDAEQFWGAYLDVPQPSQALVSFQFALEGWVLSRQTPVRAVEARWQGAPIAQTPTEVTRPDVAAAFPSAEGALTSGFSLRVETLLLPESFTLEVGIALSDGAWVLLARVTGRRSAFHSDFVPIRQPVMVAGIGRSGSTLLMRYLRAHPSILVAADYPHEARAVTYWLHTFRILSADADFQRSSSADWLERDTYFIGHNPLFHPRFSSIIDEWRADTYLPDLAAFCARSIDGFYEAVAGKQNRGSAHLFAEKLHYSEAIPLQSLLFPGFHTFLLVRDFRDILASMLAFNEKRGFEGFSLSTQPTVGDYVRFFLRPLFLRYQAYERQFSGQVTRVRYEDLITQPRATLQIIFATLGLEPTTAQLDQVIREAEADTEELKFHRTTQSPRDSIGRWKTDLSPEARVAVETWLGDLLVEYGYDL